MQSFMVRKNCEYSVVIQAEDEEQALTVAETLHESYWTEAWSPVEAEETEDATEVCAADPMKEA